MPRAKISEFSTTAGDNTDIDGINLAEGMAPSLVNDAIRELMAQLKDFQSGAAGDNITVVGTLAAKGTSASGADLKLYEDTDNGTNYVGFIAPASIASNVQWTLPSADGSSGQALQTNGSGTLSFATLGVSAGGTGQTTYTDGQLLIGNSTGNTLTKATLTAGSNITITNSAGGITIAATGGSPGGSNTQVQFNNSGAFAGSANMTFNGTRLTVADLADSGLTSGRVVYASTGGALVDSSALTFDGAILGVNGITVGRGAGGDSSNTVLGSNALGLNTTGYRNTAIGQNALQANTTGFQNTAVGRALEANTTGNENTAVGRLAMFSNTTGGFNVAVGNEALRQNTTGNNNTAVGYQAGYSNTAANGVTALGYQAAYSNTSGTYNTAIGRSALSGNTTGIQNTIIGGLSTTASTTASHNVAIGVQTLRSNTTGSRNVAIGDESGGNTTSAMDQNTTGNASVAVGAGSLRNNTTGGGNIGLGYQAGYSNATGNYNVCIGYNADVSANNVTNEITIAVSNGGTPVGKGTSTGFINPNGGGVYQGNNSSSWSTTSDRRLKKNIVDNDEGLEKIAAIRVRNFEYRLPEEVDAELKPTDAIKREGVQLGVIAQELQEVCPDCVKEESTGVLSVDSDNVFWHMVNAIKQLKSELDSVKAELATLKGN